MAFVSKKGSKDSKSKTLNALVPPTVPAEDTWSGFKVTKQNP